ncbi:PIN domain-containing protein [Azohydromonas lata]|uniref:PIN domain-containing protein n=1 Tax=Azohydromonas lata TaxID=45677 RepID=UPI000A016E60|nr:PIN domain-containing protein [Azohydromonas lata]
MSKENSQNESPEISAYKERFSNPELIFTHGWSPVERIKDNCIVSLDTNVLLAPYKLRKESIDAIEKIYKKLKVEGRIFISKQTVREFAANKSNKLAEISHGIHERKLKLKPSPEYPILFDLPEYEKLQQVSKDLKERIDHYNSALDAIADKIKEWVWHDPVVQMYSKIFSKEVIVEHNLSDDALAKDLARRNKFKIPPGYRDASKEENSEGDLSIWHTLLEIGRSHNKDLVFVSEDRKPDWWIRSTGSALMPKYELIHEYQNVANGKSLHLLIFSEFLEKFDVAPDVVEDVKSEELRVEILRSARQGAYRRYSRARIMGMLAAQGVDLTQCSVCGYKPEQGDRLLEIHHIKPLSEGGADAPENVAVLCRNCHMNIHANRSEDSSADEAD